MGFFGVLISGSLTAAIITYFLGGDTKIFFTTAAIASVITDLYFNHRDED